jgi:hypothetical protein
LSIRINKGLILNALKEHYSFKSDAAFARFLGIAPTSLASWYVRDTLNWDVIFAKCNDVNFDTLIKEGKVVEETDKPDEAIEIKSDIVITKVLEMVKELSAENALLKEKLKKLSHKKTSYGMAAEPGIEE